LEGLFPELTAGMWSPPGWAIMSDKLALRRNVTSIDAGGRVILDGPNAFFYNLNKLNNISGKLS
jgi:hypothetical protein